MTDYRAPLHDMQFLLYEVFGIEQEWARLAGMEELNRELADAMLEEAAKLTETLIAPLSRPGDEAGVRFEDGRVFTPAGFREAWQTYRAGGWIGFAGDPAYGGQGMPRTLTLIGFSVGGPPESCRKAMLSGPMVSFTSARIDSTT